MTREFVKISRGAEAFWCQVVRKSDDGSMRLRCDNDTIDPASPRYDEMFDVDDDEFIIDRVVQDFHA